VRGNIGIRGADAPQGSAGSTAGGAAGFAIMGAASK
jgi:hypothetical protein